MFRADSLIPCRRLYSRRWTGDDDEMDEFRVSKLLCVGPYLAAD